MSTYDKSALERCRTQIVKDLDIRHIVDDLIATNVIDENHYDLIKNQVRSFLLCQRTKISSIPKDELFLLPLSILFITSLNLKF